MRKTTRVRGMFVGVAIFTALVTSAAMAASGGWRVFATSSDAGGYGAYASANATVRHPKALAIRVTGTQRQSVDWNLICSGTTKLPAGTQMVVLNVSRATSCTVSGGDNVEAGELGQVQRAKIELLRK